MRCRKITWTIYMDRLILDNINNLAVVSKKLDIQLRAVIPRANFILR